jgi:hypothetical protein
MSARSHPHRVRHVAGVATAALVAVAAAGGGLSQRKPIEMEPIGTVKNVQRAPVEDNSDASVTSPNSGTPNPATQTACSGSDFESLDEALRQCEAPMPKAADAPALKDKLEVRVTASTTSTTPGGRVDLQVILRNKSDASVVVYFTGDPNPRFEVEASDAKGKRADLPKEKWPGYPKGFKPEAREAKAWKITLDKNGTARLKVTWDAVKTKWAPEKAKAWEGRGFPRSPAGGLAPGKYQLKVLLPVYGDVDVPKVAVDVG